MPGDTGSRLANYAYQIIDDALRTVAVLFDDDCDVIYLRDDLQDTYSLSQYEQVASSFRINTAEDIHRTNESPLQAKEAIIHYHHDVYVFQFPHEECHSILLSVESGIGSQLTSFIEGCKDQI
jgi:hypothetical protein